MFPKLGMKNLPDFWHTPDQFRQWLELMGAQKVGFPQCPGDCPLANWHKKITGEKIYVGDNLRRVTEWKPFSRLPEWATAFTYFLDVKHYQRRGSLEQVTGIQALEILDFVINRGEDLDGNKIDAI